MSQALSPLLALSERDAVVNTRAGGRVDTTQYTAPKQNAATTPKADGRVGGSRQTQEPARAALRAASVTQKRKQKTLSTLPVHTVQTSRLTLL